MRAAKVPRAKQKEVRNYFTNFGYTNTEDGYISPLFQIQKVLERYERFLESKEENSRGTTQQITRYEKLLYQLNESAFRQAAVWYEVTMS